MLMFKKISIVAAVALLGALAPLDQMIAQSGQQYPAENRQRTGQAPAQNQSPSRTHGGHAGVDENLFLPHLLEMNASEAEIGHLAATRGQNQRVKNFGQMIAKVHSDTVESLGGLYYAGAPKTSTTGNRTTAQGARSQNRADNWMDNSAYLGKDHHQTMDKLRGLSGAAFDRETMNILVMKHQDSIRFLETNLNHLRGADPRATAATRQAGRTDFRAEWVRLCERLLPVVKDHLQQAQNIQRELQGAPDGRTNQ
jgi:putative membrane protein